MTGTVRPLAGKAALITGSTSGIGLGIAHALAHAGCNLTINGPGEKKEIRKLCAEMTSRHDVEVVYSAADMRRPGEIGDMVKLALGCCGSVDILVNNAGVQHVAPIAEFPTERWDEILAVNLSAAFHAMQAAVPSMCQAGWGRIINIASMHAGRASPFMAAYVASQHGLAGLTKTVALELAEEGITVNAIAPGYVKSPMFDQQVADTAKARATSEEASRDILLQAQPTRKLIGTDQVAALALFLCSDAASAITGAILPVDGGWAAK